MVVWSLRLGLVFQSALPNIPNEKPYPISVKTHDRTNLLLVSLTASEPTFLAILSVSSTGKAKLLPIPTSLMANLAREAGLYSLTGAWKLGELDGGEGLNLTRDSISRMLSIPIDGYLATGDWERLSQKYGRSLPEVSNYLTTFNLASDLINPDFPGKSVYGSLTGWQVRSLAWTVRSNGGLEELSLAGTVIGSSEEGNFIDSVSFDSKIGKHFQEASIAKEHARVSIINASGITGAGSNLARYVKNLGGEVITVSSGQEQESSEIRDHLGGSRLGQRLAPLIRATIVTDTLPGRADLEIIIGRDNKGWF